MQVTHHHDPRRARIIVTRRERPPEERWDAEHVEHAPGASSPSTRSASPRPVIVSLTR